MLRVRTASRLGEPITELGSPSIWQTSFGQTRVGTCGRVKPFASHVADFDTGGWDEIFPTVDPVPLGARLSGLGRGGLTYLGGLWYLRWSTERVRPLAVRQSVASNGPFYALSRRIDLDWIHPTIRQPYLVRNAAATPLA